MSDTPILIFDVETTGRDKDRDQIIELAVQYARTLEEGPTLQHVWRFKPSIPITIEAQQIHGISMEDLADEPSFADCADDIKADFEAVEVLIGYNLDFDKAMLNAEYARLKKDPPDLDSKLVIDPYRLWRRMESRGLQAAHQRFVGGPFEGAHSALADVGATFRVLSGMLKTFQLEGATPHDLALACDPDRHYWVGYSQHILWREGEAIFSFGKYNGRQVFDSKISDYLRWVCGRDFPAHVKQICRTAAEYIAPGSGKGKGDFYAWLIETFNCPPPTPQPIKL